MSYEKKMIKTIVYIFLLISSFVITVLTVMKLYHIDGINRYLLLVTAITAVTGCIGKVEKYDTFLEGLSLYCCACLYIMISIEACIGNIKLSEENTIILLVLTFLFASLTVYVSLCDEWNDEIILFENKIKRNWNMFWKNR